MVALPAGALPAAVVVVQRPHLLFQIGQPAVRECVRPHLVQEATALLGERAGYADAVVCVQPSGSPTQAPSPDSSRMRFEIA